MVSGFWERDWAAWFRLAEAVMEDNHVVNQRVMYRTVLLHIPHNVLEKARGILTLAEGQTCGATYTQHSRSVHQHPVGSQVGRPETYGAPGGDDGGPAA